jgi:hypothetical protein
MDDLLLGNSLFRFYLYCHSKREGNAIKKPRSLWQDVLDVYVARVYLKRIVVPEGTTMDNRINAIEMV